MIVANKIFLFRQSLPERGTLPRGTLHEGIRQQSPAASRDFAGAGIGIDPGSLSTIST
jgi:hypothetical protein